MKESSTYQAILEEGREIGRKMGREQGREQGARLLLLAFGTKRWGSPDSQILAWLESIHTFEELEALIELGFDVPGWQELQTAYLDSR